MLHIIRNNIKGLRHPLFASLTLTFAEIGDAFLYLFLPQHPEVIGAPVVWIGFLLSINRFVRIIFNPLTLCGFRKYGIKRITILAAILAIISTAGYGFGWGLASLIIFRIGWGMSYAALRISSMGYAFEYQNLGFALGVSRSVQELGPMFAVGIGPILLSYFSYRFTFLYLAILSIPSLWYAIRLPELNYIYSPPNAGIAWIPTLFNLLSFLETFIVEGMLIVVLGVFILRHHLGINTLMITSLVAAYLTFRRISFILFSPFGGMLADWIGFQRIFSASLLLVCLGLVFLISGWEVIGLVLIFTFNSVNNTLAPSGASDQQPDKIKAVAENATWRDIGAAMGALAGGMLLSAKGLLEMFTLTSCALGILLILFIRRTAALKIGL